MSMMWPGNSGQWFTSTEKTLKLLLLGRLEHAVVAAGGRGEDQVRARRMHGDSLLLGAHRIGERVLAADPADVDLRRPALTDFTPCA